jgi:ABC-2 type transport system permease protein
VVSAARAQIHAELRKLLGLRTAWVGLAVGLVASPALVFLNAGATRRAIADGTWGDASDLGFQSLSIGLLGAMILGVVTVSSEYTPTGEDSPDGRQLHTTLVAAPRRLRLLAAKAIALTLVVAVQGLITAGSTLALVEVVHGGAVPSPEPARMAGAVLYWVLFGLLSYALTLIFRNGVVTLTVLIVNSTVVSVSYLLTKVTPLAAYLPDIVGTHLFLNHIGDVEIAPVTAGLVMTAWVAALLALAAWLFQRRDA